MTPHKHLILFISIILFVVSSVSATITVSTLPFNVTAEPGQQLNYTFYLSSNSSMTLQPSSGWVTVPATIGPGSLTSVTAVVKVPQSSAPGQYNPSILVSGAPSNGSVRVVEQIRIPLHIKVNGTQLPTPRPTTQVVPTNSTHNKNNSSQPEAPVEGNGAVLGAVGIIGVLGISAVIYGKRG